MRTEYMNYNGQAFEKRDGEWYDDQDDRVTFSLFDELEKEYLEQFKST